MESVRPIGLLLTALVFGLPAIRVALRLARGELARSPRAVAAAYAADVFRKVILLAGQVIVVAVGFALFPAGFLLLVLHAVAGLGWLIGSTPADEAFILCSAVDAGEGSCAAVVFGFHSVQLALVYVTLKHGERLLARFVELYRQGAAAIERLGDPTA